jgi:FMN-dependent oxidoreductase (nitrilotriacetate monooxygenase family)
MTRKIRLGAFIPATGQHVAAWRHPESQPDKAVDFDFIKEQVQLAEKGLFDAYFLADGLAVNFGQAEKNGYSDKVAGFEPVTLFAALSTVTKHIGFIATASTTYEEPYLLALKFVSLDHLSHGRAGWNVVTSASESAAANFGYEQQIPHAERYERAQEYVELIKKLWDSWEDDAFLHDKASGVFYDAEKVHNPNHKGKYYSVKGALNVPRTPQGYPVIVQAGQSGPGRDLAARYAEVIFTANQKLEDAQEFYRDVKGRLAKYGRSTDELLILPGVSAFVSRS